MIANSGSRGVDASPPTGSKTAPSERPIWIESSLDAASTTANPSPSANPIATPISSSTGAARRTGAAPGATGTPLARVIAMTAARPALTGAGTERWPRIGAVTTNPVHRRSTRNSEATGAEAAATLNTKRVRSTSDCTMPGPNITRMAATTSSFGTKVSVASLICVAAWKMDTIRPTTSAAPTIGPPIMRAVTSVRSMTPTSDSAVMRRSSGRAM